MIPPVKEASLACAVSETGGLGGHLRLGDVDNTGDTVASPNYGSRVDGHVLSLGSGDINIETSNSHNYSIEAGAVLNVNNVPNDEQLRVVSWLNDLAELDFAPAHRANLAQRCDEVGAWVLEDKQFQKWSNGTFRTLWVHGILGSGKTILISNIIEHLETKKDGSACLFIFFDYAQKNIQTPYNITTNLLKQLVQQRSGLSDQVRKIYEDFKHLNSPPSIPELLRVIDQESKRFAKVRLVVDGLDECPAHVSNNARAAFLHVIRSLSPNTSLLITSRTSDYDQHDLGDVAELRYAPTDEDMHRYLRVQLQNHCAFNEVLARANHDTVVQAIALQAKGMLLLARLHMNSVAAQHTLADLQLALTTLEDDTRHTYQKAMQRISTGDKPLAERVLMWLTFAMRPLTMEELRSALSVNENVASKQTAVDYMHSEKRLLDVCAGLVVVDHRTEPINVHLIHPTARAFFEVYFDNERAHKSLGMTCLRYLQFEDLRTEIHDRARILQRLVELPLLRYAALNWGHHAHLTQDKEVVDMSIALLNDKGSLTSVVQAMDLSDHDSVSGLYIAAHFGLVTVADQLLLHNPKATEEGMDGETPLHAASREGHVNILTTLLSGGTNPDQLSGDGRTPVSLAAENGHLDAVRRFIGSYGVDPNSKSTTPFHKGRTPLSWASGNGHHAVVEYLLAQDNTQVDAPISYGPFMGRTALMLAAHDGHDKVVELLLGKGQAVAGIVDGDGMSAIALAAQQGYAKVVELLLNAETAAAHKRDAVYNRRPVDWASSQNHEEVVRLLLMHPSLDSKDAEERTMLSWEAQYGNLDLVQRLLDYGADPNSGDEEKWTPLTYASKFGHTQVVKLLLQANANIDAQSIDRRSALSFASEMSHHETVRSLLMDGAKPDEPDRFGRTPLSYAAGSGSIVVVEVLLRYEVDVNLRPSTTSWSTQPPIMWADAQGHKEIIKKLLETGKVILTPDDKLFGESAISWAKLHGFTAKLQTS